MPELPPVDPHSLQGLAHPPPPQHASSLNSSCSTRCNKQSQTLPVSDLGPGMGSKKTLGFIRGQTPASSGKNMAPKCGLYALLKWPPCFYTFARWLLKTHDLATERRLFAEEAPKGGGSLKGGLFAVVLRQTEDSCPHFSSRAVVFMSPLR